MRMTSHDSSLTRTEMRPARVQVVETVASRYPREHGSGTGTEARPANWDSRKEGIDTVRISSGETVRLRSSAMQSPPRPGWILMLTGGTDAEGYSWTLYGISRSH
jgi:hypothetical protein